jgi:hypothetical protein
MFKKADSKTPKKGTTNTPDLEKGEVSPEKVAEE